MRVQHDNWQFRELGSYGFDVADPHPGVELKRLPLAENQITDGFLRLVRLINCENAWHNAVNFEPPAVHRHTAKRLILRAGKLAAPIGDRVLRRNEQRDRQKGNS